MGYTDGRGLAVSTTSAEALTAYEQGLTLALRWRSGAMDAFHAAVTHDAHFALAHCARTYVGLRMGLVDAALAAHQQAMSLADHVQTEREHLHLQATDALARSQRNAAQSCLEQISAQYPTDRLALWLLSNMRIAQGDYVGGLALARHSVEACPDEPFFQTMTGFFLEQSGYNDKGLATSLRSLEH